jgi:ribosomal-protein-serine acetyltransferase
MTFDPTTLDFPEPIETERLIIRGPRPGDGAAFNAAILDSLEGITTWLGYYRDGPPTVAQSEAFIRSQHAHFVTRENLMMLVFLKESGVLVASSGLHPKWDVPSFEIGYWCRTPYSGNGYVTEAVRAQTDFAFEHLGARRVYIRCDTLNHASANVAKRAGFTWEATLRCDSRSPDGRLRDTHYFSIIKPE